ncbi:unnamed protein product [Auanema sp. JU1783]|nr:unnamed protein product [Auanema sp. JU1783]
MDTNFKFSNIVGSVYRNGTLLFSKDGNTVISPVGNKISVFDLKNNVSQTLSVELKHSIVSMALSDKGTHLTVATEHGEVYFINLLSDIILHTFHAHRTIKAMDFSPNGRLIAICRDNDLQIHEILRMENSILHPYALRRTYHLSSDTLNSLDWSADGCLIIAGGADKIPRIVGVESYKNLYIHALGSHKGPIVTAQFLENSYDNITVDRTGYCQLWKSSLLPGELELGEFVKPKDEDMETTTRLYFEKTKSFSVYESSGNSQKEPIHVSAAKFHAKSNLLVTAFSNGVFVLHEIPTFALIHNLRVSDYQISSLAINRTGDWLALGCGEGSNAQLIVWEWQSETYVLKQQAHSQRILTAGFSPDGALLATGAEDGKVKIWNNRTSFCTVTFDEHTSAVTAVAWTQNGKAILSASLDGTIRAHDLKRYRNFRTLVCPEPTQFAALVVDKAGDIVCAIGKEVFNVYIWNLENGRLLDVMSGHTSNITALSIHGNSLVTTSWDRTVKVWNIVTSESSSSELSQEGLAVSYSPCGLIIAVLTMDSTVTFYTAEQMTPVGTIEGKLDLDAARLETDLIARETSAASKAFTRMAYSPDGELILLGGDSNFFCMYSVSNRILLKKFTITANRSLDGVVLDVNRRNFTEFGNMALADVSDSEEEDNHKRAIRLPGSKHFDLGERKGRPEVAVYDLCYCPTGRKFGVACTEGVSLYSLDTGSIFDPFQLDSQTSPKEVNKLLSNGDYFKAIVGSLRLNDSPLIQKSLEMTPMNQIPLIVRSFTLQYAERLLKWVSEGNVVWSSPHIHFYMIWIKNVLHIHGAKLKGRADVAILTGVQQIIAHHQGLITKL